MRLVAFLSFLLCLSIGISLGVPVAHAGPARPPAHGASEIIPAQAPLDDKVAREVLLPPPPSPAVTAAPSAVSESEPPSPIPWIVATLSSVGMLLAVSWAALERRRARVVSEELSRIRMHRTAPLRVTRSLGDENADRAKTPT